MAHKNQGRESHDKFGAGQVTSTEVFSLYEDLMMLNTKLESESRRTPTLLKKRGIKPITPSIETEIETRQLYMEQPTTQVVMGISMPDYLARLEAQVPHLSEYFMLDSSL
jgi:hypothetical protein